MLTRQLIGSFFALEPTLSVCCFRYVAEDVDDLDAIIQQIFRQLVRENEVLLSTTRVNRGAEILTYLDLSNSVIHSVFMANIKISSRVDETTWNDLKAIAQESHQNVSGLLTEAIRDYVQRRRVRPQIIDQLEASMDENDQLGKLLAK